MSRLIISPVTIWDEDNELWETKIGLDFGEMPLLFSAWGKTKEESHDRAVELLGILEAS